MVSAGGGGWLGLRGWVFEGLGVLGVFRVGKSLSGFQVQDLVSWAGGWNVLQDLKELCWVPLFWGTAIFALLHIWGDLGSAFVIERLGRIWVGDKP